MQESTAFSATSHETDESSYLREVGARMRRLRTQRGMTRRFLAASSRVSERYLADLELGKGNISILRLRDIAIALGVTAEALVSESPVDSLEFEFLNRYIRSAPDTELARLYTQLSTLVHRGKSKIVLIGLRGAGKSTLGAELARRLGFEFVELVRNIQVRAGMPVSEIFSLGGQTVYRRVERQCLDEAIDSSAPAVIAVGGSIVSDAATYERVLSACLTIWLRATPAEHMSRVIAQGDHRPMAGNNRAMDDLQRILIEREALYRRADHVVDTSGRDVTQSLAEIIDLADVARIIEETEVA